MKPSFIIFISFFIVRLSFSLVMGFYNNYNVQPDSYYLIDFSNNALSGDFNFDYGRFITSPAFSCLAALFKIVFNTHWDTALVLFQITLSSISGIYLYKTSLLIFKQDAVAILSAILYCFFPMTLWYVYTFSQETLFQCLFIFSVYFLIKSYKNERIGLVAYAAFLFSLTYLTKSHILLFSLFIPFIYILNTSSIKKAILYSFVFAAICVVCSLPYGLYHVYHNKTYVLSSNGSGMQFYLGNTNAGYISIVDVPEKSSPDYIKMKDITNTAGYFNGDQNRFDSIISLPQHTKQKLFFADAYTWIKQNPEKIIKLKLYDLVLFLNPGVSFRHYAFKEWLFAFILCLPLYLFAYWGIYKNLKSNFAEHFYMLAIFFSMILFSTVFYVQNRFRTITIEPYYILYASYCIFSLYDTFLKRFFHKDNTRSGN